MRDVIGRAVSGTGRRGRSRAMIHSAVVIASWCWVLIEPYFTRNLQNRGIERPTRRQLLEEFARVWPEMTATIGVQAPHAGTIRFKWLARLTATDMEPFLADPEEWIRERFGGGK